MSSIKKLERKIQRSERAAGEWSGDESGSGEDRANNAMDAISRLSNKIAIKKHGIAKKMKRKGLSKDQMKSIKSGEKGNFLKSFLK